MMQKNPQPRRFACDRCRNYKLRCERNTHPNRSCERCQKTGVLCTTTKASNHGAAASLRRPYPTIMSESTNRQERTDHTDRTNATDPHGPSTHPLRGSFREERRRLSPTDHCAMNIDMQSQVEQIYHLTPNINTFSDFSIDCDRPSTIAGGDSFDHRGSFSSSGCDDYFDFGNLDACLLPSPSRRRPKDSSLNLFKELLELCANLVSDSDALKSADDYHFSLEQTVQCILNQTSQLSQLLETLLAEEDASSQPRVDKGSFTQAQPNLAPLESPQSTNATPMRAEETGASTPAPTRYTSFVPSHVHPQSQPSGAIEQNSRTHDDLVMNTIVTTYVLIVRIWRHVYSRIGQILAFASPEQLHLHIKLPRLQLGGINVESKPIIQTIVLLHLSSSMLETIETCLGMRPPPVQTTDEGFRRRLTLNMNPAVILYRDAVLSQELSKGQQLYSTSDDAIEDMRLEEMMDEVKKRLGKLH